MTLEEKKKLSRLCDEAFEQAKSFSHGIAMSAAKQVLWDLWEKLSIEFDISDEDAEYDDFEEDSDE